MCVAFRQNSRRLGEGKALKGRVSRRGVGRAPWLARQVGRAEARALPQQKSFTGGVS